MTPIPLALPRVLVLEDDVLIRDEILLPGLRALGFQAEGVGTAATLHIRLGQGGFGLVLLDVGLPDSDGFVLLRELRQAYPRLGLIMLTGCGALPDQIRGLTYGADAYLAKPAGVKLIAATLISVARRLKAQTAARWRLGESGWQLISPGGRELQLNEAERRILQCLFDAAGRVVSKSQLADCMDDEHYDFHRLETVIYRLRKKVLAQCGLPLPISAVHGIGYAFKATT